MAYSFNGTTQYISGNSSPLGTGQLGNHTWAVWLNADSGTAASISRSTETTGTNNPITIVYSGNTNVGSFFLRPNSSPNGFAWNSIDSSINAFVSGTWKQVVCTLSGTLATIYVDGVSRGTNNPGGSVPTTTGLDRIGIGALVRGSVVLYLNGLAAEVALWNVALNASEAASLGKGFSPRRVRPQSLVFYAPLVRNIQDLDRALALTNNNGATVAAHPRVI